MFRKILMLLALCLAPLSSQAALTMTVNTSAKTVAWSGVVTSGTIFTTPFTINLDIIVATAFTPNPSGPTPYVQLGTEGLVMTSHSTTITNGIVAPAEPRLYVDGNNVLTSVIVATIVDVDGGGQTTVTVTGDFNAYDYGSVGLSPAQLSTLEGLDGAQLRFYRVDNGLLDLGPAGTVVVAIPEPGPVSLLVVSLLGLALRRTR